MKTQIDIENWNRKEHYEFFSRMDEPFFGLTAQLDCTKAYLYAKEKEISFFQYYHYLTIRVVNAIDEFKLRIEDGKVVKYDTIHVGTTVLRPDNTFAFSLTDYTDDFDAFSEAFDKEIAEVMNSTGLRQHVDNGRLDQIHFTTVPWVSFTAMTHARNYTYRDSVPKIAFGKFYEKEGRYFMPVSVNGHHGLMDGYHAGRFYDLLEQAFN